MSAAACATLPAVESERLFFSAQWADRLEGIRLCRACPVVDDCLAAAAALETSVHRSYMAGTWGGLTVEQRVRARAR